LLFLPLLLQARVPTQSAAGSKRALTEIKLRSDPAPARIRPHETLVLQVLAYGQVTEGEQTKRIRLRVGGAKLWVQQPNGGWLSKPFRYQWKESEPFYGEENVGLAGRLLSRTTTKFTLQDAFLYTAPEQPGRYTVKAELKGKTASLTIEVTRRAPSRRTREQKSFSGESKSSDPYRRLAEHYAPFVAQETWWQPKSDYLARFDFDGDWEGENNWDNQPVGSSQAYVHYAVMETQTHWFLLYNLFHPRDYSDRCVAGTCHENDNEGLILTIAKDGSPYGRLQVMETLAHNNIYSYRADRRVKKNVHSFDGEVEFYQGSHPVIFVESGGHGIYGSRDSHARFSLGRDEFTAGTGVTYIYKGIAERPQHANHRQVGYELLSIYDQWWLRAQQGRSSRAFDAYYAYQPYGDRPRPAQAEIAGAFRGRKHGSNKAKPFWGWHDRRTRKKKVLAVGQWGLDPAYGVSRNLTLPEPFSLDYAFNPYLGIGTPSATVAEASAAPPAGPAPSVPRSPEGVTLFEHDGYTGRSEVFRASDSNLKDNPIGNDQASSIRVPPGYTVTLYKDSNFRGRSVVLRGDAPSLGPTAVGNDQVSSLRVELDSSARPPAPTREPPGPEGITLFEHDGYTGRSEVFRASDSNLKDNLIGNDRASSIRVPPGYVVTLYKDSNFRGRSVVLRGDVPALGRTAVGNDQVSSLRVERIP
jgi:hypothetical protein